MRRYSPPREGSCGKWLPHDSRESDEGFILPRSWSGRRESKKKQCLLALVTPEFGGVSKLGDGVETIESGREMACVLAESEAGRQLKF